MNCRFACGWGVAYIIDGKILFDTGDEGQALEKNIISAGCDISNLQTIVISHDHWDHTGGLNQILPKRKGISVLVCPDVSENIRTSIRNLNADLVECGRPFQVTKDIFTTGSMTCEYKKTLLSEQGLVIRTANGHSLITGCAHPGMEQMINKTREQFSIEQFYAVIGGFHLFRDKKNEVAQLADRLKNSGIQKIGPCHCSGRLAKQIFKEVFQKDYLPVAAGQQFDL